MAKFTPETKFVRTGGRSPATCYLYGTLTSDAGELSFRIVPGAPEDGSTPQPDSIAMRKMFYCNVICTSKVPTSPPQIAIAYDAILQTYVATVTVNAADVDEEWIFRCEGEDRGQ